MTANPSAKPMPKIVSFPEPASAAAAISAPRSDEDHQSTPGDHRRFCDAGPRRVPSVFVGAAPNADDSHNDVGKRKEMETDGDSVGQASEDRSDGGRRRQNIGDGAIGDGVVPKGLAKRKIATPKRYQCVSHDARALFEFRAVGLDKPLIGPGHCFTASASAATLFRDAVMYNHRMLSSNQLISLWSCASAPALGNPQVANSLDHREFSA